MGDVLTFTNLKSHKIQLAVDGHLQDLAGSDIDGLLYGPASQCQFAQPSGITIEKEKSINVNDTQTGVVKLHVDTEHLATFCHHIGMLYDDFGIHKKCSVLP